jgi:secreted PhoX family phosphatase
MGGISRRTFLQGAAAASGGVVAGGSLQTLFAGAANASGARHGTDPALFELGPVEDLRDGVVRLWLPPGFEYRSFHDTDGAPVILDDGTTLPGRHDGMAAFRAKNGNVWLVRNHEQNNPPAAQNPQNAFGPGDPYDQHGLGGTTTSLVTPRGEVLDAFTSLNGTMMNCSGGRMPWRAWITCEETVNGPDVGPDFTGVSNEFLEQPHGFIFEVPAGRESNRTPIKSAGRFAHEAAAYSPREGIVYLTEDNFAYPSGFYRYVPPSNPMHVGHLEDGGQLQMLKVADVDQAHLEAAQTIGARYRIEWVDIDEPYPGSEGRFTAATTNDQALNFVGNQGRAKGAAGFSRLEGATFASGEIYFTSTQGGGAAETGPVFTAGYGNGTGQVWSYRPRTQTLTCRYQSPNASALELPDNITAHDHLGSIVICEDGPADNYVRRLDVNGQLQDLALNRLRRNADPAITRFGEEFAGATFGAEGRTLFVNIQAAQGITFAIWGPWGRVL